jgi:hypothetical protein
VAEPRAFVFADPHGPHRRARTLREFVDAIEGRDAATLAGYLRRGDFSRWIADVFGDHALADALHEHEERYRLGLDADALPDIAAAVRGRYDLTANDEAVTDTARIETAPNARVA